MQPEEAPDAMDRISLDELRTIRAELRQLESRLFALASVADSSGARTEAHTIMSAADHVVIGAHWLGTITDA